MKKFNPEKELQKVQFSKKNVNNSKLSNMYVPLLVIACSCLAMVGITFSANLAEDGKEKYSIKIDVINGDQDSYSYLVKEGPFSTTLTSINSFGSIQCTSGELSYNPETGTISSPYINKNTSCVLSFMDDVIKKIEYNDLDTIADNSGVSYYYKADATNNYIKVKDMMFRIVRINGDGSYRILLEDALLFSNYGNDNISYFDSNLKQVLDNWFNVNFSDDAYVVNGDFDVTNYVELDTSSLVNEEGYAYSKVGTLSAREVALITKDVTDNNYLNKGNGFYLANANGVVDVYAYDGQLTSFTPDTVLSVKPVINVIGELEGTGTLNNPYILK